MRVRSSLNCQSTNARVRLGKVHHGFPKHVRLFQGQKVQLQLEVLTRRGADRLRVARTIESVQTEEIFLFC